MKKRWKIGLATVCATSVVSLAVAVKFAKAQGAACSAEGAQPGEVTLAQTRTHLYRFPTENTSRQPGEATLAQARMPQEPGTPFEVRLWQYLRDSRYQNWAPFPGTGGDFLEGHSPHGAFVKTYINRTAAADPNTLPLGSILVKENYGKDRKSLMAVTVMYRTKGYDSEHKDWYWVKYEANGAVSEMDQMKIAGKVSMCIECHSQAKGDDFAFGNDGH